jgi:hypothetical protein
MNAKSLLFRNRRIIVIAKHIKWQNGRDKTAFTQEDNLNQG